MKNYYVELNNEVDTRVMLDASNVLYICMDKTPIQAKISIVVSYRPDKPKIVTVIYHDIEAYEEDCDSILEEFIKSDEYDNRYSLFKLADTNEYSRSDILYMGEIQYVRSIDNVLDEFSTNPYQKVDIVYWTDNQLSIDSCFGVDLYKLIADRKKETIY